MNRPVLVNRSYAGQRVTGQQRYAEEISRRLMSSGTVRAVQPTGFWSRSVPGTWAWVQLALPRQARGAVLLSLTARAPLRHPRHVVVVHDLFVLTNPEWYSPRYVRTHAPLLRAQLRGSAAVVAVSEPVAEQIAPLVRGPIVVAPNAPTGVFWQGGDTTPNGSPDRGLVAGTYFLAVGSRDPRKNLLRLAAAYARLTAAERRRHPLVVVGGGSDIYGRQVVDWPDGTVVTGYVLDEELRRLYRGSLSVVFVSLAEGFGLPLVEAAAAGASSLLVSDIPVFRWICGNGARYVDPLSPDDIAAGLRAQTELAPRLEIDSERFTWDASARVVGEVCAAVAART